MLLLGVKHGTKVGRPQFISTDDAVAILVVSAFHASTPDGCHLCHLTTYQSYCAILKKAWRIAGVEHLSFTPHSARSGWATECRLQGMDFTEIKQRGRWSSDKSLLTYLDASATIMMQAQTGQLQQLGTWLLGDLASRFPWWR